MSQTAPVACRGDVPVHARRSARSRAGKRAGCAPRAHAEFARRVARGGMRRLRAVCPRRLVAFFGGDGALPRRPWCLTARSLQAAWGRGASPSPPSSHGESHPELEPQPGRWKVKVLPGCEVLFLLRKEAERKRSTQKSSEPRRFKSQARVLGSRLLRETLLPKPKHTQRRGNDKDRQSFPKHRLRLSRVRKSSASPWREIIRIRATRTILGGYPKNAVVPENVLDRSDASCGRREHDPQDIFQGSGRKVSSGKKFLQRKTHSGEERLREKNVFRG